MSCTTREFGKIALTGFTKHHSRFASIHLKDRKKDNGPNMPWGQGDTPIKEVLQLMKKEKYPWPATIELEYPVPEGSTRVAEIGKCLQYCKAALTGGGRPGVPVGRATQK